MKKALKWGLIISGGIIVLVIAALLVIPLFVDLRQYKPILEEKISEAAGRPFSLGDDIRLSLFPTAGFTFSDLQLGNLPGFTGNEFVTVKSGELKVKLLPLLSKDIRGRFVLKEPKIVLIKDKMGRGNWSMPGGPGDDRPGKKSDGPASTGDQQAPESGLPVRSVAVEEFSIENGTLVWIDETSGTRNTIDQLNLKLENLSLDQPVGVDFSIRIDQQPVSVKGSVGPVGQDPGSADIPLDLVIKALDRVQMKLKGKVLQPGKEPRVSLSLQLDEFSPRKLMAAAGRAFPLETSDPKTLEKISVKAQISADSQRVSMSNGLLNLDDSRIDFSFTATDFTRPNLKFDLAIDRIDLDRYLPPQSKETAQTGKSTPSQKTPAKTTPKPDYTPLREMTMDGRLKAGELIVSRNTVEDLEVRVRAKGGIITIDPFGLNLYQGSIAGAGRLDVRTDTPASQLTLKLTGVQIGPLLRSQMEKDLLEGAAEAQMQFRILGDSPEQIKKSLSGEGELMLKDGAVKGVDLASMARNIQSAFKGTDSSGPRPRTDFAELKVPFTLKNGLFETTLSSLQSPFLRLIASGQADLVNETLKFRVEPKVVGTIKGQGDTQDRSGIMVPVVVSGTFASPEFKPDLKAAAGQQLQKRVLDSDKAKKIFENEKLKPYEESTKGLLKKFLN